MSESGEKTEQGNVLASKERREVFVDVYNAIKLAEIRPKEDQAAAAERVFYGEAVGKPASEMDYIEMDKRSLEGYAWNWATVRHGENSRGLFEEAKTWSGVDGVRRQLSSGLERLKDVISAEREALASVAREYGEAPTAPEELGLILEELRRVLSRRQGSVQEWELREKLSNEIWEKFSQATEKALKAQDEFSRLRRKGA